MRGVSEQGDTLPVGPGRTGRRGLNGRPSEGAATSCAAEKLATSAPNAAATLATEVRAATLRHPWFAALLGGGRPHQGPGGLAHLEALLAAFARVPGIGAIDVVLQVAKTFNAYVVGAIRNEASERSAALSSGMTKDEWQQATGPYLRRMIATGDFPAIGRV
ncbi:MAG TPA: TetR/AcrR family transcriptional regulator C-terminal domain-containing protein [Sphingomonas sp.]